MSNIRIRKVGNSLGVIFPQEVLDDLNIQEGDEFYLARTEQGFELTPCDPNFSTEMEAYRHVTRQHCSALRKLSR